MAGAAQRAKHRAVVHRLRGRNRGIDIAHRRDGDHAALITVAGFTPKKAGDQTTRSASLPTSMDPTSCAMPWVSAGLMVYLAM